MATPTKALFLTEIQTLLKKRYKPSPPASKPSILEAVVYAICHEGAPRAEAEQLLSHFKTEYFDWNEVRVTSVGGLQAAFADRPDAEARATSLRRFLRQLFAKTYAFSLDALAKKPQKDALKTLGEYEAFRSDFVEATVVRLALGGHAIPVDHPMRRALVRLGVVGEEVPIAEIRGLLERAVPKTKGPEFIDLMEDLAHDVCIEGTPLCGDCELKKVCPTAPLVLNQPAGTAKVAVKALKLKEREKDKDKEAAVYPAPPKPSKTESAAPAPASGRSKGKPNPST